ncbi:J domain-containing protein [Streptomyces sp. NPDC051104]|uniref:J domain-containing protein n=1 Tax=Streptomyces sp. NPDC051104 TaxID=3155044 RepID=UPI00343863E6
MDTWKATGAAPDHYDVLGVDPSASAERITSAYRRLVRRLHPDTRSDEVTEEALARVLDAYETLRDPAARAALDRRRRATPAASPAPVRGVTAVVTTAAGLFPARTPLLRAGPVRVERTL